MKQSVLIGIIFVSLFSFLSKGRAASVLNPFTRSSVLVDSIVDRMMNFAPFYEKIVKDYRAELYIKGKLNVKKKNFMFRYVPTLFKMKKGVRKYVVESLSDLHYTAPGIYDQKVKAGIGTVPGGRRFQREMLEYFHVNIYSSTLLYNRLLSPLALNGKKYYHYQIDSVMGTADNLHYKVRFIPKSKSDQLVGGYMVISANVWSVREIRFSGRSELLTFENWIKMGEVGAENEFLPVRYEFNLKFNFMGNVLIGSYLTSLNYHSIVLKEVEEKIRERRRKYDLSESFTLRCDTNTFETDSTRFAAIRPIALKEDEVTIYKEYAIRRDSTQVKPSVTSAALWKDIGDFLVSDYSVNLSKVGSVGFSPLLNPLLVGYGGNNGFSYRQDFDYKRTFSNDRQLYVSPRIGYNFTRKEFYWSMNADFNYWPRKRAAIHLNFGNGNRIYSSEMLDELKAMPDSLLNFDQIHLDYFRDLFFTFRHSIELVNGFDLSLGFSAHRRTAVQSSSFSFINPGIVLPPDLANRYKNTYISFAPRVRVEWTPCMYYYMNGKRKENLRSAYPTFSMDWERGLKGVFNSTGQYERIEFDLQHKIPLGLMRNIYYRFGFGSFTNTNELYFVDFANFSRNNLPVGWNDDIGGVFQLLDGRWYNSSRSYVRGHFTYEAPFLFLRHLMKYTRYVNNERLYISALCVPHLNPYIEVGYGIGTHIFDFGVFVGSANWKYSQIGCKFTFELFNR